MAEEKGEKPITVIGAIVANAVIAAAKFVAAAVTGSAAMMSEGIHSVIDTGNEALLLIGRKRSRKPPDSGHPFGYGKELYFWSLLVAVLLFGIGGGMSIYEGIHHLVATTQATSPTWSYVVLGIAFVAEGTSWVIAIVAVHRKETGKGFWDKLHHSKDPAKFIVVGEDTAALAGLVVAFVGVLAGQLTGSHVPDGIAAIVIGVILCSVAVYLVLQSKHLLIGESADRGEVRRIREIIESDERIETCGQPLTMHFGPKNVLVNVDIEFVEGLSSTEVAATIDDLERRVQEELPDVSRIYVEPQCPGDAPEAPAPAPAE